MWRGRVGAVAVALLIGSAGAAEVPPFAVTTAGDGKLHVYSAVTRVTSSRYTVEDEILKATLDDEGAGQWRLTIQAKHPLRVQYFPWQIQRTPLGDIGDDFYYYPYILGISEKASTRDADWTWRGLRYPGELFAPLVVMADSTAAILVAATNWPPRAVIPMYAAQRLVLRYDDSVAAGGTSTYSALIVRVSGNEAAGEAPWQLALDRYRAWLETRIPAPEYPSWMWSGQGFLNVQLENAPFSPAAIDKLWQPLKSLYPWLLFWGQMTTTGRGCCELIQTMSGTYHPALVDYVTNSIVAAGYHAGYYSAPYYSSPGMRLDSPPGIAWLASWLAANRAYGANAYYIDTLGRQHYGDPARVLNLFSAGTIPDESLIEGAVDIYPAASLVSGALVGNRELCGAPQKTPARADSTTFPRFGRYLLGDRLMFSGQSNTDWRFWGTGAWTNTSDGGINSACGYADWCATNGPCAYGAERLNFLLGAKLDVMTPNDNPILDAIHQERLRVNWWARRPVYQDTRGLDLTAIPAGSAVEIRRFRDRGGEVLLVVSNPNGLRGLYFRLDGALLAVPSRSIAIMDLANRAEAGGGLARTPRGPRR